MNDNRSLPEDDEPIRLEHDDVRTRLETYRSRTGLATAELLDLTQAEPDAEVVLIPEAEEPGGD